MSLWWLTESGRRPYSCKPADADSGRLHQSFETEEERRPVSVAAEIASRNLITIQPQEPLTTAQDLMNEGGFRHLPVVDPGRFRLVGLLSDRDLLKVGESKGAVREVMTRELLTALEETPIHLVVRTMLDYKISCVPVCDEQFGLCGLITTADILKLCIHDAPLETWLC